MRNLGLSLNAYSRKTPPNPQANEPAAVISTEKLYQIAGEFVGKDDPAGVVRAQPGLPALGEVLEGFTFGHLGFRVNAKITQRPHDASISTECMMYQV